jgi:NAD(P)-dependent dehydrogenase (short-subunit alcohol dehydrogenase family)
VTALCADRVCVVTGAGQGIGLAHAVALAQAGARVVVNDVDERAVDQAVARIGDRAVACVTDASTGDGAAQLIQCALDTWDGLDVVVNNAGITRDKMLVNLTEEDWDSVLQVHLKSTFLLTRGAARYWRERSKAGQPVDGRVINTVSSVGLYGHVGQSNYGAAKGAIASFTITASLELGRYGVTVNALCPTALTQMTEVAGLAHTEDGRAGRLDPRWVSPALVWLASPRSADVTGRVIVASGRRLAIAEGWHRGPTAAPVEDPAQVEDVIRGLLAQAAPNADDQGDIPPTAP